VSKQTTRTKSLAKGLLAGLIGGIVATAAKSMAEKLYPPKTKTHGEPEPPILLEGKIGKTAGHGLTVPQKAVSVGEIHWGFGAAAGAAYGAVAEYYPAATERDGAAFGITLVSLTHAGALPMAGLSINPEDQTPRERSSEMVTYIVYGVVTETVRKAVRKLLR
jgi:putative membrane protein